MVRRSFFRRTVYLFALLLVFGLAAGATLADEPGKGSGGGVQIPDGSVQASERLERARGALAVHRRHSHSLMGMPGVVGSGVDLGPDGEPVIKVFTARHGVSGIPDLLEGVRVRAEVSGRIYALRGQTCDSNVSPSDGVCTTAERWPLPVPTGVSVGHPDITAGTIAARVTKGTDVYVLSNNHVLANINQGKKGIDSILQPGAYDGGTSGDEIATLTDFSQIEFCTVFFIWVTCDRTNTIDAAIALSDRNTLGFSTPVGEFGSLPGYGAPSSTLHPAYGDPAIIGDENLNLLLGIGVQKYGRTTGLTTGNVTTINATMDVCYDSNCENIARFTDQLIVTPGGFSAGGDSGSLVVSNDSAKQPVGLLFAGSDTMTIVNRIDLVLNQFGVTIDGEDVVRPKIDVAVTGIDVATPVQEDQPVTVTVTVVNRGTEAVTNVNVTLGDGTQVTIGTDTIAQLAPNESTTTGFPWTPTTAGTHTLVASLSLSGDQNAGNDTYSKEVNVLLPPGGPQLQVRKVLAYTDRWITMPLDFEYGDEMVVVCSPNYDLSAPGPAIARVRNARGSSFEVGLGRPWYGTFGGEDFSANVYCMVVRQGVYTLAEDGVKMEAVKIPNFTSSDHAGSWAGQRRSYQNSYTGPVVVGQVVSPDMGIPPSYCPDLICEQDWSVFWSRGTAVANPPSSSALYVGRHTGEDRTGRPDETLAYVVIESGKGTIEGRKYVAALGGDTVKGMQNKPPFTYSLSGLASASVAIVSQAGMDAGDGGWALLYGPTAVSAARLRLAIDEDWYLYSERNHTTEQVGYIVFE